MEKGGDQIMQEDTEILKMKIVKGRERLRVFVGAE